MLGRGFQHIDIQLGVIKIVLSVVGHLRLIEDTQCCFTNHVTVTLINQFIHQIGDNLVELQLPQQGLEPVILKVPGLTVSPDFGPGSVHSDSGPLLRQCPRSYWAQLVKILVKQSQTGYRSPSSIPLFSFLPTDYRLPSSILLFSFLVNLSPVGYRLGLQVTGWSNWLLFSFISLGYIPYLPLNWSGKFLGLTC